MGTGKLPSPLHEALVLVQELYQFKQFPGVSDGRLATNLRLDAVFKQLLGTLMQSTNDEEREEDWLERMRLAVDYMEKHFAEAITRNDMAKRGRTNAGTLLCIIQRATGSGFTEYLTRLRLEKAREELLSGDDRNLDRIAREIGYQDGLYLSRKFKQYFGYSPRDYIQRPKRIVAPAIWVICWRLDLRPQELRPSAACPPMSESWGMRGRRRCPIAPDDIIVAPDLIVTSGPNSEPLSQLAPTISLPWGQEDPLDELLRLGRALNREREAKNWMDGFRAKEELVGAQVAKLISPHASPCMSFGRIGYGRLIWRMAEDCVIYTRRSRFGHQDRLQNTY